MKPYKYAYIGVNDSGRNTILDKYHYKHSEFEFHGFIDKAKLYTNRDLYKSKIIRVLSGNSTFGFVSINDVIQCSEIIFLMGGLGAKTGNVYFPILSKMLSERNAYYKCIVNTPFYFEGKNKSKMANIALKDTKRFSQVNSFSLEDLKQKHGNLKIRKFMKKVMLKYFELAYNID